MNPFDALLARRGELKNACLEAAASAGPLEAGQWRLWRDRIVEPGIEDVLAFVSRTGGDPHPYDFVLRNLAATALPAGAHPVGAPNVEAVRALGAELLDLPTLPAVAEYTEGLGEDPS